MYDRPRLETRAVLFVPNFLHKIFMTDYTTTMRSLLDVFFESMQKRRLIDQQINVYMAWIEKHHGWNMMADKKWLEMFVEHAKVNDVDDITTPHFEDFIALIDRTFQTVWACKEARMAVLRFMRYYEARTKSFTKHPRRVVSDKLFTKSLG